MNRFGRAVTFGLAQDHNEALSLVRLNIDIHPGPEGFVVAGDQPFPCGSSTSAGELAARLRFAFSAGRAEGIDWPGGWIVVTADPAIVVKSTDLAVAVGIMVAQGTLDAGAVKDTVFFGTAAPDGHFCCDDAMIRALFRAEEWVDTLGAQLSSPQRARVHHVANQFRPSLVLN